MGWASGFIAQLQTGKTIQCRPRGNSMMPKIKSGQLCTIVPVGVNGLNSDTLTKGDIVLCKVNGKQYLHLISAVQNKRFQISNNHGRVNGWVTNNQIYGKCIEVSD